MKYQIQFSHQPKHVLFHLSERITKTPVPMVTRLRDAEEDSGEELRSEGKENLLELIRELLEIEGVESVEVHRHGVIVERARLFEWKGLVGKIREAIHWHLCPTDNFVPAGPPTQVTFDEMGVWHEGPAEDPSLAT